MLEFEGVLQRNRALQELLKLARTVVADGMVTNTEAEEFRDWVETNPDMSGVWPVGIITKAMKRIFADGELTEGELRELLELLEDVAGEGKGARPEEWGKLDRTSE